MSSTVELHRVLKSTPDRIYRAFTTAGAFAKWLPPYGFFATVHEMDSQVGGHYRMSFTNLTTGAATASAANTWSWSRAGAYATRPSSRIRACRAGCRPPWSCVK